ncbi:hypothetical protein M5E87_03705 [Flavonifractor plautii]|nr:hypothetical protein M5E87_03705 [Flavonifractor plautii]
MLDAGREKQVIAAKTALTDDPARKADVAALYEGSWPSPAASSASWCGRAEEPGYAAYAAALAARREPVAAPGGLPGEPGCYSEEAAVGFFGPEVSSRGLAWFPDVFAALERGRPTMRCFRWRTPPPAPSGRSTICWPSTTTTWWGSAR